MAAKTPGQININDLPDDVREALYKELKTQYGKRGRANSQVSKEDKLLAIAEIFRSMRGLNLAQQRGVLKFAIQIIENTQKRLWRDKGAKGESKTGETAPGK